jgi:hypothetical protein
MAAGIDMQEAIGENRYDTMTNIPTPVRAPAFKRLQNSFRKASERLQASAGAGAHGNGISSAGLVG